MSDIDFDELDRAVASVLNGSSTKTAAPAPATPTPPVVAEPVVESYVAPAPEPVVEAPVVEPTPEPAPLPTPEPVAPVETPHVEEPAVVVPAEPAPVEMPAPEEPKVVAPAAQALHPITAKPVQRGRFLDMVHPSQDMGPRSAISVTPRPAVPVAAQVANQTFVSDIVAPKPESVTPSEPVTAPDVPAPVQEAPATSSEEVEDTIDANDFFGGTPAEGSKVDEPAQSPFIADAKVQKRPLGAFPSDTGPLPVGEELHDRLVQVESEDNVIETAESPIPGTSSAPALAAKKDVTPAPSAAVVTVDSVTKADDKTAKKLSSKASSIATPKVKMPPHGHGNAIRITVAIAVLLIGFGVGATLYFVVLH